MLSIIVPPQLIPAEKINPSKLNIAILFTLHPLFINPLIQLCHKASPLEEKWAPLSGGPKCYFCDQPGNPGIDRNSMPTAKGQ